MREFRLEIRLRNNLLLRRMEEIGLLTGGDLARLAGISISEACRMIALRYNPIARDGSVKGSARRVEEALCVDIEGLWPAAVLAVTSPRQSMEVGAEEMRAMMGSYAREDRLLEDVVAEKLDVQKMLRGTDMDPRRLQVIADRVLDEDTLDEIGKRIERSRDRVRQITESGLSKLRKKWDGSGYGG